MKKRYLVSIFMAVICPILVNCQSRSYSSELNPEYIKYLQEKKSGTLKTFTPEGYRLNYIPSPLKLTFKSDNDLSKLKSAMEFPNKFDLRDSSYVTSVKDQGTGEFGGNCVAFATMGALESNWLKMGKTEYDLSEQNQAACYGFEWAYGDGATARMPCAYLSRFSGPILESEDPYNLDNQVCNSSFNPVAYVPEVRWLPKDIDLAKRLLLNYGALVVSVHIDPDRFNYTDNTYYYAGDSPGNHAFLLCGWDDEKQTAGGTGAWVIKNSWSDEWAENGFIYVSYNDTKIMDDITLYPHLWDTDEVDQLYMYDHLGVTRDLGIVTAATEYDYADGLVKFRATSEQLITKVGTYVLTQGTILDIDVYKSFNDTVLSDKVTSIENIYIEYPGFYTFNIPFQIEGDFYIRIKYSTPGHYGPVPIEAKADDDEGGLWADPILQQNVCWYGRDDTVWISMDTIANPANVCIRAYGRSLNKTSGTIATDKPVSCLNSDIEFTAVTTGDPTSFEWNFGAGAEPATASTEGPHTVTYSTIGAKHASLIVSGAGGTDTTIFYNAVEIVDQISLNLERDTIITPSRLDVDLKAYGADTYAWEPADNLDKTEGNIVTLDAQETGTLSYTVTGTQGDCSAQKIITVISRPRPANDDVCEALFIKPGGWIGNFSNINATVQDNEPAPESGTGTCNTPLMWCSEAEGKLQNSVWFWFYGPPTGIVSIDAKGFDNQIALYRADTCTDILEGTAILVAANDDYYDVELNNAAAIDVALALPDQKYYLQLDGSFGGQEGNFNLIFMAYPLGQEEVFAGEHDRVVVFPNPSDGTFTLQITQMNSSKLEVEIYNTGGQLISRESWYNNESEFSENFDLRVQPAGVYHMRIVTEESVFFRRLIKR